MKGHRWVLRILVMAVLALAFSVGHAIALHNAFSGNVLPIATLASALIISAVAIHLGLIGALVAIIRRRFFDPQSSDTDADVRVGSNPVVSEGKTESALRRVSDAALRQAHVGSVPIVLQKAVEERRLA